MSVSLFSPIMPRPRPSLKKAVEPENDAKQSCQVCFRGDKNAFSHPSAAATMVLGKGSYV